MGWCCSNSRLGFLSPAARVLSLSVFTDFFVKYQPIPSLKIYKFSNYFVNPTLLVVLLVSHSGVVVMTCLSTVWLTTTTICTFKPKITNGVKETIMESPLLLLFSWPSTNSPCLPLALEAAVAAVEAVQPQTALQLRLQPTRFLTACPMPHARTTPTRTKLHSTA